jgi:Family of unknown function (DUF5329)
MQGNSIRATQATPRRRSMTRAPWWLGSLATALAWCPAVSAPSQEVSREVDHLLQYIGQSDCDFYRNGSWYDGRRASAHLRLKYEYLSQRHQIATAEDFIEKAATRSSLTSRLYKVRCAGGAEGPINPWLGEELVRYRTSMALPPTSGRPSGRYPTPLSLGL